MRAFLPILLVVSFSEALPAQLLDSARVAVQAAGVAAPAAEMRVALDPRPSRTTASTKSMIVGGMIGGALGAFGGAMVGKALANCGAHPPGSDDCALTGMVIGGLLGEAIGVPIGVNFVANGRNTLARSIPASVGVTIGSLALGAAGYYAFIPAMPGLQLYTSINIERTGKMRLLGH